MAVDTYMVSKGGLMRCCLATLDSAMLAADEVPAVGTVLPCIHCSDSMIVAEGGFWKWHHD